MTSADRLARARARATLALPVPPPWPPLGEESSGPPRSRHNAVSLAFLGDAVWEAALRSRCYDDSQSPQAYGAAVAVLVTTQAQARAHALLLAAGWPTKDEAELLRWASNSSAVRPPPHATRQQYKQATALEALVAHLYLVDVSRLDELLDWLLAPDRLPEWRSAAAAPPGGNQRPSGAAARGRRPRRLPREPPTE